MTMLRFIGIFILNTIGILVIGCTEPKDPDETVTAYIPAEISDKVYVTTFPRCNHNDADDLDEFSTKSLVLNFQAKTFSGNINGDYHCPSEGLGMVFRATVKPLYKRDGTIVTGRKYLYFPYGEDRAVEQVPNIESFYLDSTQAMLIIDGMTNQSSPLKLVFTTYDEEGLGSFHNYYRLSTLLDNDFLLQYKIRIMNDAYNQRFNLSGYDTQFAQAFKDVIAADGNILKHPEIIQGFVDNNERVINFFKDHRQIMTQEEFDEINNSKK
ncbi:hypothetical protein ACTXJH_02215 [Psychrobacter celer]|uniref:hypothetical protein n=1 Tax=Psychrobacter celer TaxID=306572 RepID=UPI003FD1B054